MPRSSILFSFINAASKSFGKLLDNYSSAAAYGPAGPLVRPQRLADSTSVRCHRSLQTVTSLLTVPAPSSFPPPLGCYPGLNPAQKALINSIEGPVFGLTPIPDTTHFEPACYLDRPVYGVLEVLRLRLPFIDSRIDVARQAVGLKCDAVTRVLLHSEEALGPLPGTSNKTTISAIQSDPRQYGALRPCRSAISEFYTR
jgi:hypothetical protein